ncbi:TetR/AcrR family transcriptional regulator [Nocardia bovistercoris]|uniref:TetR/AcrR family transcriptional regulator n=1 Tax=Nocardia bovistercoris TaxID=2785916 RepID=A0A931N5J3_9NOCA|nr:TetR/AcrR family transcriptional regulator [Nocardia bovistercoris]MBH0779782.1 TetR/AcrR family transcriptional regulator [Nocardia bovistercoris]
MATGPERVHRTPDDGDIPDPRVAGLVAFHRQRKQDSRARILAAAAKSLCERGYFSVSVEDIATNAQVSRMTFYRHFRGKADLAAHLFESAAESAMPLYLRITTVDSRQRRCVIDWITTIFEADQADSRLLRVFAQATADDGDFTPRAQRFIADLIRALGISIPAFRVDPDNPAQRRRWLEAWLLLYEILDQSSHAALASGVADDPLVIEILADRFLAFVTAD